ncbi:MAG: hypothetical protein RLY31_2164 [Bacteroidota bacterium]|jgi:Ser/Thr protein kinase RdoA (MazF antagonist)
MTVARQHRGTARIIMEQAIRFFFGDLPVTSCTPFGSGHINDTYRLEIQQPAGRQAWLLQRVNHLVFRAPAVVMSNIRSVSAHLSGRADYHASVLTPLASPDGSILFLDPSGHYWRVFPFFEGTRTFDRVERPEQAFEAARAFGAFLRALDDFPADRLQPTIPGFHDGMQRLRYFQAVLRRALPDRLAAASEAVREVEAQAGLFPWVARLGLPIRVIHHDTKINNVLFDRPGTRAVCVIDLDTTMPGVVLSDFGDMMRTFTNSAEEDAEDLSAVGMRMDIYQALSEGFRSEMQDLLSPAESAALSSGGLWLTLMQAVRFLADFLEGDPYYKVRYPTHNLVRTRNQLALYRSMLAQLGKPAAW